MHRDRFKAEQERVPRTQVRPEYLSQLIAAQTGEALTNDASAALIFHLNESFPFLFEPGDFGVEIAGVSFRFWAWHTALHEVVRPDVLRILKRCSRRL
jgi:hypothetical protein